MIRKLYTKGIRQLAQAKQNCVTRLLAHKRATKPLLKFLQSTKVERKEKAKEKKLEQKKKNN